MFQHPAKRSAVRFDTSSRRGGWLAAALLCLCASLSAQGVRLAARADRPDALYRVGETVAFGITLSTDDAVADGVELRYRLRLDDFQEVGSGRLPLSQGQATVSYTFEKPSWMLLYVYPPAGAKNAAGEALGVTYAGAMCAPDKLEPGSGTPDDFEVFWNHRKAELDQLPFEPRLERLGAAGDAAVSTYAIELKNIGGTSIHGYLAVPAGPGPFPAVLKVNAAGVYSVRSGWVSGMARHGALALDINAHDIPNGRPGSFYDELKKGALNNYPRLGRESRDSSYFLRMFCSCYRAARYLMSRSDWDGTHLVAWGSSQGGGQAFVTAALCPGVTAFTANVPALCDHGGMLLGRRPGWPQLVAINNGVPDPAQLEASRYFDCAHFARLTRAKALVSCGFIDRTCSPASVWAAYNRLPGPKEMVNMVETGHGMTPEFGRRQRQFILHELGLD